MVFSPTKLTSPTAGIDRTAQHESTWKLPKKAAILVNEWTKACRLIPTSTNPFLALDDDEDSGNMEYEEADVNPPAQVNNTKVGQDHISNGQYDDEDINDVVYEEADINLARQSTDKRVAVNRKFREHRKPGILSTPILSKIDRNNWTTPSLTDLSLGNKGNNLPRKDIDMTGMNGNILSIDSTNHVGGDLAQDQIDGITIRSTNLTPTTTCHQEFGHAEGSRAIGEGIVVVLPVERVPSVQVGTSDQPGFTLTKNMSNYEERDITDDLVDYNEDDSDLEMECSGIQAEVENDVIISDVEVENGAAPARQIVLTDIKLGNTELVDVIWSTQNEEALLDIEGQHTHNFAQNAQESLAVMRPPTGLWQIIHKLA